MLPKNQESPEENDFIEINSNLEINKTSEMIYLRRYLHIDYIIAKNKCCYITNRKPFPKIYHCHAFTVDESITNLFSCISPSKNSFRK